MASRARVCAPFDEKSSNIGSDVLGASEKTKEGVEPFSVVDINTPEQVEAAGVEPRSSDEGEDLKQRLVVARFIDKKIDQVLGKPNRETGTGTGTDLFGGSGLRAGGWHRVDQWLGGIS